MKALSKERFLTTMDYKDFPEYAARASVLANRDGTLVGELKLVRNLLRAARNHRVVLLQSASGRSHPDLLTAIMMGFWGRSSRPAVIMMGCMWQKDSGLAGILQKLMLKLADRAIFRYAPQSTGELTVFAETWGVEKSKLRFVPYFFTFTEKALSAAPVIQRDPFIFSGGNSHRDYESLVMAAEALPEHQFVVASNLLDGKKLPSNVQAGQVSGKEFIGLMRAAQAVVIPIKKGLTRATAQQTYLNAMLLEKPTIITDALGVRDHVQDGKTAIVVDGSPDSFVRSIRRVFDPANQEEIARLKIEARRSVLCDFTFEKHSARLLEIIDEAVEDYYRQ